MLTSYVIAAAIMTAPVGWMAVRFGRKRLFIICIIGFTVASMLCGAAQSLEQLVGVPPAARHVRRGAGAAVARPRCWTSIRSRAAPRRWRSSAWG